LPTLASCFRCGRRSEQGESMTIEEKTAKKKKVSSWAIQVQWDNGDVENITEIPNGVAHEVDEWLTEKENE